MSEVYLGVIMFDPGVCHKIRTRPHGGCTENEVREAFQNRDDVAMRVRPGTRPTEVAGFGTTASGRELFAAFVAVDELDGTWRLKTAWPV